MTSDQDHRFHGVSVLTAIRTITSGRADETDTADNLPLLPPMTVTPAVETDTAHALTFTRVLAFIEAAESDAAAATAFVKRAATGFAEETDTALARDIRLPFIVRRAIEADEAFALLWASIGGQSLGGGRWTPATISPPTIEALQRIDDERVIALLIAATFEIDNI